MAGTKGKKFVKLIYILVVSALLIITAASTFQTIKLAAARVAGDFFYPYLSAPALAGSYLSDQTLLLRDKYTLASNLEQLKKENSILSAKSAATAELTVENEELRKLLKLPPPESCNYIYAEIILRDPLFWEEHFTINRGSQDGLVQGAAVLAVMADAQTSKPILAGIVKNVSKHSAEILTLMSPEARFSAYLPLADAFGFINSDASFEKYAKETTINFLPRQKRYKLQEQAITTGFEKNIPAGLLIGQLSHIESASAIFNNKLYLSGSITPAVNLNGIHFVIVTVATSGNQPDKETAK